MRALTAETVGTGLRIRHADAMLVVLDKPSGLLSVPAKPPGPQDCLEARVRAAFPGALLVHRLDRDTSGVMVFARNALAQRHLNWQFERRQVRKGYVARVRGHPQADSGRIDLPLICDWPNRPRQMVCHLRGKPAITDWRVLAREAGATRLQLSPLTGRSHQLRVHLLALGHPILGDPFYGPPEAQAAADRLQLHAESLAFRHPDGGAWVEFDAPVPF
ncbi:RluA family pseudouridine synthase [Amaricoccus sp.]|uniref:RluA family pseudouridine synthase n=1 Tax=Amaricoccus sp. TaxID=1872485 RepID=UPI003FA5FAA6